MIPSLGQVFPALGQAILLGIPASKFSAFSAQKRFQGATQTFQVGRIVPHPSGGGNGKYMVSTDHMQKASVQKSHTVAYGGQTILAVSWSTHHRVAILLRGEHFSVQELFTVY